jgi:hypothetical protein
MGIRQDFEKRISKKEQEIADLELQIRDAKSYLQALTDSLKLIPKNEDSDSISIKELRAGTTLSKARDAIISAGKPLHINDILKAIGKPLEKRDKVSLSGSLSSYVRKRQIFTKTAPNTFGLVKLKSDHNEELPETFGKV